MSSRTMSTKKSAFKSIGRRAQLRPVASSTTSASSDQKTCQSCKRVVSDLHLSGFGQRVRLNCKHCLSCRLSRDIENDFDKLLKKDDTYKITVDDLTDCVEKKMDQVDRLNQRLRRSLKRELSFAELITIRQNLMEADHKALSTDDDQSTANAPPAPAGANGGLSSSDRSPQGNPHAANNEANSTSPSTVSRPDRETSNEHTVAAQDGSANQAVTAPTHNNSHEASTPALNSAQHTSNAGKKRKPSEEAGTLGQMSEHNIRNNLAKIVTDQRYWDERIANSKATIEKEERLLASYDAENVQLDEKRDDYRHELHRRGLTE